ncbi:MAG: glycosyl hydrolase 53 family protein [Treponema sp.]|nr:glycosyl hydrolase 53 family protein [Treponema sp.]
MKKSVSALKILSGFIMALILNSCEEPQTPDSSHVEPGEETGIVFTDYSSYSVSAMNVNSDFMRGVDVSEVAALEELGQKWYSDDNRQKDVFVILKEHGVNWVRIRIWNDYTVAQNDSWGPYGYNNLARTVSMSKRAVQAGLKVFLDFHYSDNWADPAKQYIPEMWKSFVENNGTAIESASIDVEGLATAVASYTTEVMQALKDAGALPSMVQLGNEMQGGIFARTRTNASGGVTGSDGNQTNLTTAQRYTILIAAKNAVKAFGSSIKVALHCSDPAKYLTGFLSGYAANVKPDVVAYSYYPYYTSHGTDTQLAGFNTSITNAGYEAVMAEFSYSYNKDAWTDNTSNTFYTTQETAAAANLAGYSGVTNGSIPASIENQAGVMKYVADIVSQNGGIGFFYWGGCYLGIAPQMNSSWENQALFDVQGKVLPGMDVFNVNN